MDELLKYKRKIFKHTLMLVVLCIAELALVFAAAPEFSKGVYSLVLLAVVLVQIIIGARLGMLGNKITLTYIKSEEDRNATIQINDEKYEEEVDKKITETADMTFNIDELTSKIDKTDDWKKFGDSVLYALSKQLDIAVGLAFKCTDDEFTPVATFAYYNDEQPRSFKIGEGISGQVVKDHKAMFLNKLPSKSLTIVSGLGQIEVNNLAIIPILRENNAIGLIEIATFKPFEKGFINKIEDISNAIGSISPQ